AALKSRSRAAFWAFPVHPSALLYSYFRRRGEAGATAAAFGGRSHRRIVAHRGRKPKRLPPLSDTARIRHVDVNYENVLEVPLNGDLADGYSEPRLLRPKVANIKV